MVVFDLRTLRVWLYRQSGDEKNQYCLLITVTESQGSTATLDKLMSQAGPPGERPLIIRNLCPRPEARPHRMKVRAQITSH